MERVVKRSSDGSVYDVEAVINGKIPTDAKKREGSGLISGS
jgi:hypothetical protein